MASRSEGRGSASSRSIGSTTSLASTGTLERLLAPYLEGPWGRADLPANAVPQLAAYLELLLRWNAKTNLTAVRSPEEIVRRHFGESLFAGLCLAGSLGREAAVLDLGSGAGFPGLPMQILRPEWRVTLAESQGKKVSFLREVIRVLGLGSEVWPQRAEDLPPGRRFDAVTMRAVDRMGTMVRVGESQLRPGGLLLRFSTEIEDGGGESFAIPEREHSFVVVTRVG